MASKRVARPAIGTKMYHVCEHFYYEKGHAGPLKEFCVCESTVTGFYEGGYVDIRLLGLGPDGFLKPTYIPLKNIGLTLFYSASEASLHAKEMTERQEVVWGFSGETLRRPWESLLNADAQSFF